MRTDFSSLAHPHPDRIFIIFTDSTIHDVLGSFSLDTERLQDPTVFVNNMRRQAAACLAGVANQDLLSWTDITTIFPATIHHPQLNGKVFNNEHCKGARKTYRPGKMLSRGNSEAVQRFIDQGGLENIFDAKREELVTTLHELVGTKEAVTGMVKRDLIDRILSVVECDFGECSKQFTKPAATTGGWMFATCEHGIIICAKPILKQEGPQVPFSVTHAFRNCYHY